MSFRPAGPGLAKLARIKVLPVSIGPPLGINVYDALTGEVQGTPCDLSEERTLPLVG